MRFYVDFEALDFSKRIISIGCIDENGNEFYTLVKPPKEEKVNGFITKLTGITNEMLEDAPSADEAFNNFKDFILKDSNNTNLEFYFYGNADEEFLEATKRKMEDEVAIEVIDCILTNFVDFTKSVKSHFSIKQGIALRKLYFFIIKEECKKSEHNALEDVKMLKTVVKNLNTLKIRDLIAINNVAVETIKKSNYLKWENDVCTESEAAIKAYYPVNGKTKYFKSMDEAIVWAKRYLKGISKRYTGRNINKSIKLEKPYFGIYWQKGECY